MTENQKLREVFEARMTDNGKWPRAVEQGRNGCYLLAQTENAWAEWQACAEALALPTADHLPDAGKMIETAAPVGERDALDAARYRWLADCNNYPEAVTLISDGSLTADALGKAIDAAMRKGQL